MLRWVFILHKHIGLVLAFLLVVSKLTHARILVPVKMPSTPSTGIKELVSSTLRSSS